MTDGHLSPARKRARQDGQKLERRQAILETAWGMFQQASYATLTMDAIAHEVGLAKGTLFLYFRTKEELFLAVTQAQLGEWFVAIDRQLSQLVSPVAGQVIAGLLADSLREREGFARLLAILSTGLEQNVSYQAAFAFKQALLEQMTRTGAALEACLPFLGRGEGASLLMQCQALVVGLWHLTDPAPVVKQVFEQPEMQAFRIDFHSEFRRMLAALLDGLSQRQT